VVLRGCVGDYVQFDIYNEESLGYFLRSGITHFGSYTCDYKTGDCDEGAGQFASGKIEVWVGDDGKVGVSGKATCDDVSMDNIFRQRWIKFEREVKEPVKADTMGLISWEYLERINNELESIATHDDRPVACIRLQLQAPALSQLRTVLKSEQPLKWFGQRYLVLIRSFPSTTHHQSLPQRCSVHSSPSHQTSEIEKSSASATSAPPIPRAAYPHRHRTLKCFSGVPYEFERPRSGTLNTSPVAMQRRFGYEGCTSSSSEWLWCDDHWKIKLRFRNQPQSTCKEHHCSCTIHVNRA